MIMAEKPDIVVLATGGSSFTWQVPGWGVAEGWPSARGTS